MIESVSRLRCNLLGVKDRMKTRMDNFEKTWLRINRMLNEKTDFPGINELRNILYGCLENHTFCKASNSS